MLTLAVQPVGPGAVQYLPPLLPSGTLRVAPSGRTAPGVAAAVPDAVAVPVNDTVGVCEAVGVLEPVMDADTP